MKTLAIMVAGIAVAITVAAPAGADGPDLGSSCSSRQLNVTATSSDGTSLRCLAVGNDGYIWTVDNERTEPPWLADQIAMAACRNQGHTDAECRAILKGG
jgi:hypothetical protein